MKYLQTVALAVQSYHASLRDPAKIVDAEDLIERHIAQQGWYAELTRAERHVVHQQAAKHLKKLLGKRVIGKRRSSTGSPVVSYSVFD